MITYAADGDIYTVDPVTGVTAAIVSGPPVDSEPVFSPDGTQIAFRRGTTLDGSPADDIVVVSGRRDRPVVVTAAPDPGGPMQFEWAPDSKSLLVDTSANGAPATATLGDSSDELAVWLFDATAATPPTRRGGERDLVHQSRSRPPDGNAILINRPNRYRAAAVVLDVATGKETVLATGGPATTWRGSLVA